MTDTFIILSTLETKMRKVKPKELNNTNKEQYLFSVTIIIIVR